MSPSAHPVEKTAMRSLPFTQRRNFRKTLNERVNAYLSDNHLPARDMPAMYVKTAIMLAWWLVTYLLLLLGGFPPLVNVVLCVVWAHGHRRGRLQRHARRQPRRLLGQSAHQQTVQPQRRDAGHERVPLAHQAQRVASHLHQHRRLMTTTSRRTD